jgi:elongation factor P hydroxylase
MPKERIFGSDPPYTEASSARGVVGVTWHRDDEHVQVFVELFNDDLQYVSGEDYPDVVPVGGREPIKTRTADGEAAVMRKVWADGFYVSMDRNGINKLIRNLRRARDQAFGRDE